MKVSFIDIKVSGKQHMLNSLTLLARLYYHAFQNNVKIHSRPSFGFTHLNVVVIQVNAAEGSSSIRINMGLDSKELKVVEDFLKEI